MGDQVRREPSEITIFNGHAEVSLTRGFVAIIDLADVQLVAGFRWTTQTGGGGHAYAARSEHGRCVLMHRQLLEARPGMQVDHRDGDGLNNRRNNIRLCTPSENMANKIVERRNKLGLKGVHQSRGRYRATIKPQGRTIDLGSYNTPEEAAAAYRGAARILWGRFSKE